MQVEYVALATNDVRHVASGFENCLGLARHDIRFAGEHAAGFSVGRTKVVLLEVGSRLLCQPSRTGVDHIAVSADDPAAAARQAFGVGAVDLEDSFEGGTRAAVPSESTNGLRVYFHTPIKAADPDTSVTERIDHLGVVTDDNEKSRSIFSRHLGLEVESFQTDIESEIPLESFTSNKYGVVYHTRAPRLRAGIRGLFMTIGDFDLEFLESFDPGGMTSYRNEGPGHTRQDQGAIARFLASRGPGLHHIALKVHDINRVLEAVRAAGHRVIDQVGRPGGRRSLIGFVHPTGMGGILVHFVQRQEL